jgi:hypothetical protein
MFRARSAVQARSCLLVLVLTAGMQLQPTLVHAVPPAAPAARQLEPLEPLHLYHGGKLAVSLLMAGTAATAPDAGGTERLLVGGSSLLLGLPAAAVLYHSRRGHTAVTRRWQLASFAVDLVLAGSLAAYGAYLIAEGDTGSQWTGLAALTTGVSGILVSRLDLMPFQAGRAE